MENSNGQRFSPCLNPVLQLKKVVILPFMLTHDLILSYIFLMNKSTVPVMLYFNNFTKKSCSPKLNQTLSKNQ